MSWLTEGFALNNREIATLVWSAIAISAFALKQEGRSAMWGVVRALCQPILLSALTVATLWIGGCVILMEREGLWEIANLKTTVIWAVTFPNTEVARLEAEDRRLKAKCDDLEKKIGADDSGQRLTSTLNNISMHMSGYISALGAEFSQYPARLDLHNLTVAIDRPNRPILMPRTGGGENHLAYHLAALLALHRFSVSYSHAMPQFLLIDQPTQVYFPSEAVYEQAGGSIERTEQDADLKAVRRLFELLRRFTEVDAPGFQIIVTEHANLRDPWFQSALVETPWTKPPALVPEDWPDEALGSDGEPEA